MTRLVALVFWGAAYSLASLCGFLSEAAQLHSGERFMAAWRGDDDEVEP
jgi:hypothetical protein